jgi:sigma-B regulation protein RsbU (phosphoserine phosphatase)
MRPYESAAHFDRELSLAAEIQRSMLPAALPALDGYSFWVLWQPAFQVGGDIYDFQMLPSGELFLLVGDVAGKGIPAALGMVSLAGMVPAVLQQTGSDLTSFLRTINTYMCRCASRGGRFATLLAATLDPEAHRLMLVDAGHEAAFIRRHDGRLENLCPSRRSLPLGVLANVEAEAVEFELRPGDVVVMATDGITGATSSVGAEYGAARLAETVALAQPDAAGLGEAVWRNVKTFVGSLAVQDDATLICFSRDLPKAIVRQS